MQLAYLSQIRYTSHSLSVTYHFLFHIYFFSFFWDFSSLSSFLLLLDVSFDGRVKYFDMPSAIMYDALVRLSLKFAAILLSGNIALNKSPMLSTDRRLKLLTDTFASQKISAFMLSPGVINPRDCDEQAELSPGCFEKATSFFCLLSTLCLIASMCFFCLLCCNN